MSKNLTQPVFSVFVKPITDNRLQQNLSQKIPTEMGCLNGPVRWRERNRFVESYINRLLMLCKNYY